MVTTTITRHDVLTRIETVRPQLLARGVRRLALFGSFSRGTQRPDSDIDFLLEFAPATKNFDNFIAICELLENTLQRPVEVVTPESLSPHIGPRILEEAEDVISAA
jgi:predicted nucleotidyltransferase